MRRLREWWHYRTRGHTHLVRDDVEAVICYPRGRLSRAPARYHVRAGDAGWTELTSAQFASYGTRTGVAPPTEGTEDPS